MNAMKVFLSLVIFSCLTLIPGSLLHAQGTPPLPPGGGNNFTIRVFLQGLYIGGQTMRQVHELKDGGVIAPRWVSPIAERFTLELHTPGQYGQVGFTYAVPDINLLESGFATVNLPTEGIYYLTIRTRNHLETVTSVPINLSTTSSYDFTTAADKAYGNNLAHLGGGVYGIYAGDINQDGILSGADLVATTDQVRLGANGYRVEDVNGDGVMSGADLVQITDNIRLGISSQKPD